jgi:hypothetical protein
MACAIMVSIQHGMKELAWLWPTLQACPKAVSAACQQGFSSLLGSACRAAADPCLIAGLLLLAKPLM